MKPAVLRAPGSALLVALLAGALVGPGIGRAQPSSADTLSADLDTDVPLSSKILPTVEPEAEVGAGWVVQADALLTSHYMAQGIDSNFDHKVAQSSLTAARGAFSATLWNNYDTRDRNVNEIDVACNYTRALSNLALSVGYQHMAFPNRADAPRGNELTFNAALDAPLAPALNVHYDFDTGDGLYLTAQVTHALPRRWET